MNTYKLALLLCTVVSIQFTLANKRTKHRLTSPRFIKLEKFCKDFQLSKAQDAPSTRTLREEFIHFDTKPSKCQQAIANKCACCSPSAASWLLHERVNYLRAQRSENLDIDILANTLAPVCDTDFYYTLIMCGDHDFSEPATARLHGELMDRTSTQTLRDILNRVQPEKHKHQLPGRLKCVEHIRENIDKELLVREIREQEALERRILRDITNILNDY